jgi:hypothetical protein
MAVAIDATGTEGLTAAGVTNLTGLAGGNYKGLTVGAGLSNGAILVMLSFDANVSALSVTWGAQTLTRIGTGTTQANGFRAELFGGVAPTSGNQALAATWTTAAQCAVAAISVSGANQTGGTTTFAHVNTNTPATGSPTTISLVVTSAVGNMVGVAYVTNGTISSWAAPATSIYVDISPTNMSAGAARQAGAASTTVTANIGGATVSHTIIGVDIVAAAAADILMGQAIL